MEKNRDSHFSKNRAALIQYVQSKHPNSTMLKFADDTVIVSCYITMSLVMVLLLRNLSPGVRSSYVANSVSWI